MVKIIIKRKYEDMELLRKVDVGEKLEVSPARAMKLTSMGLAEIVEISKLSKEEYAELTGKKSR